MTKFNWHLLNLVTFIMLNLFVKIDLQLWLDHPFEEINTSKHEKVEQGDSFEFCLEDLYVPMFVLILLGSLYV